LTRLHGCGIITRLEITYANNDMVLQYLQGVTHANLPAR